MNGKKELSPAQRANLALQVSKEAQKNPVFKMKVEKMIEEAKKLKILPKD